MSKWRRRETRGGGRMRERKERLAEGKLFQTLKKGPKALRFINQVDSIFF